MLKRKAISLFSSAGIGELGIKNNDIEIILSNELLEGRHKLHKANFPNCKHVTGDIWEKRDCIVSETKKILKEEDLFLVYATPPCQGMSSTGAGKILSEVRKGKRNKLDERNRLIIPTLDVITKLKPEWIIFENVDSMKNTIIMDENNNLVNILNYIEDRLGEEYSGGAELVDCSDYAIPQSRKRLITIFTKNKKGKAYFDDENKFFIESEKLTPQKPFTLREAIGHLPPIHAKEGENFRLDVNEYYMVPVMKPERYSWVKNTKEGESAFNNQCINPDCLFDGNKKHGSKVVDGVHSSNKDTPLFCENCGSLLPRPYVIDRETGEKRLIKGYGTTYARMEWDKPALTLTQNFQYDSSGTHYHPEQNRTLSIFEGLILQTILDYEYTFKIDGKSIDRTKIAEVIGESVPPKLIDFMCKKILKIDNGTLKIDDKKTKKVIKEKKTLDNTQLELFSV